MATRVRGWWCWCWWWWWPPNRHNFSSCHFDSLLSLSLSLCIFLKFFFFPFFFQIFSLKSPPWLCGSIFLLFHASYVLAFIVGPSHCSIISSSPHISFALLSYPPHHIHTYPIPSHPFLSHFICLLTFSLSSFYSILHIQSIIMAVQAQYPSNVLLLNRFAFSLFLCLSKSLLSFHIFFFLYLTPSSFVA